LTIRSRTTLTLAAAAAGILIGLGLRVGQPPGSAALLTGFEVIVRAWTNAFRLLALPLIFAQLFVTIASWTTGKREAGRMAWLIPMVFTGLWAATALLTIVAGSGFLSLPVFSSVALPLVGGAGPPVAPGPEEAPSPSQWVDQLIPSNLFASASSGAVIPLMLFAVVLALASRRLLEGPRGALTAVLEAGRSALFVMVDWLISIAPIVILAVCAHATASAGLEVGGALLSFTIIESGLLVIALLVLYPLVAGLGRASPTRFARAVWPAQVIAATTRSSLATVPALLKAADTSLALPSAISATVIPLAGAALKLSRAVSDPITLLFLAKALGIPLSGYQLLVFSGAVFLLSPSSLGIPRATSGTMSLPIYIALGIPPEYVVLFAATTAVADVFMTLLNTTGYLAANLIVARFATRPRPAGPT
jgi:Na+/H+-dicarboxylate symporter